MATAMAAGSAGAQERFATLKPAFERARAALGERGVIDLIGVAGYCDLVSMTLNVAQVKPPSQRPLPLPPRPER